MTIGIAVDADDVDYDKLFQAFCALSTYEVTPHAVCVSLRTFRPLLACFASMSMVRHVPTVTVSDQETHLANRNINSTSDFSAQKIAKSVIHRFADLPLPTAVCARDVLSNADVIFGEHFEDCRVSKLRSYREQLPLLWYGCRLLTGRHVRQSTLLLALNQMGADKVIVLGNQQTVLPNTPKCFYLNLEVLDLCDGDQQKRELLDFLYFPPGRPAKNARSSFPW